MWPKQVHANVELDSVTNSEPWSATIMMCPLKFTGHLFRADGETHARLAPNANQPQGNQKDQSPGYRASETIWKTP